MEDLEHASILSQDDVPEDSLLGYLVGIVHHKFMMAQEPMEKIMKDAKLKEEYWPNKPRALPAFQAACRSLETPRIVEMKFVDPQTKLDIHFKVEFMIDTLSDGSRQLTRKIHYPESAETSEEIRKILDIYVKTTQKEPEKMAKFVYDTETKSMKMIPLYENPDELDIGEQTQQKYAKAIEKFNQIKRCYTERYLKDAWVSMLRNEGAIPWLKNCGSLWFIPKTAKQTVEAFGEIYLKIHNNGGTWRTIPIIDTKEHRKYLKDDVETEYEDRFKSFLEGIAKKIESDMDPDKMKESITKNKDKFEEKMREELVSKYNKLLGMNITSKIKEAPIDVGESTRLKKAREYLLNL